MSTILGHAADEVYREIVRRIENRQWPPKSRIPPQLRLTKEFSVSRSTIQKVVLKLLADGQIETRRGGGTFVAEPAALPLPKNNVISVMCILSEVDWTAMQNLALNEHSLLCLYSQDQNRWHPELERIFLQQVKLERHKALLGAFSPLPPVQEPLLAEIAAQGTRVVHLTPQTVHLPQQEYLMPDYRKIGFMAGMAMALQAEECLFARFLGDGPYALLIEMGYSEAMSHCGRSYDPANQLLAGEQLQPGHDTPSMQRLRALLVGSKPVAICARDLAMKDQIQACVESLDLPKTRHPVYWAFSGNTQHVPNPGLNLLCVDNKGLALRALQHVLRNGSTALRELVPPQLLRHT